MPVGANVWPLPAPQRLLGWNEVRFDETCSGEHASSISELAVDTRGVPWARGGHRFGFLAERLWSRRQRTGNVVHCRPHCSLAPRTEVWAKVHAFFLRLRARLAACPL